MAFPLAFHRLLYPLHLLNLLVNAFAEKKNCRIFAGDDICKVWQIVRQPLLCPVVFDDKDRDKLSPYANLVKIIYLF